MSEDLHFKDLNDLFDYIAGMIIRKVKGNLKEKSPLEHDDIQDQMKTAVEFMWLYESHKRNGDHWLALRYLLEDLRYYETIGDMGKCGHILLETADCLSSCGEALISGICCCEAILLLVGSRSEYQWARELAATGELLLASIYLNTFSYKETKQKLRAFNSRLPQKERRALAVEDAHKVTRRMITAYRTQADKQLQQLIEISPHRRKAEEKNVYSLLIEWIDHYDALRTAVERISPTIRRYSSKLENN
jgi:hypothetical protein